MSENNPHYHGQIVRDLFLFATIFLVIGLPWFSKFLTMPISWSLAGIVILTFASGLANPREKATAYLNAVIAVAGLVLFETQAVQAFLKYGSEHKFFLANQALAVLFIFATYYAVRTARAFFQKII